MNYSGVHCFRYLKKLPMLSSAKKVTLLVRKMNPKQVSGRSVVLLSLLR